MKEILQKKSGESSTQWPRKSRGHVSTFSMLSINAIKALLRSKVERKIDACDARQTKVNLSQIHTKYVTTNIGNLSTTFICDIGFKIII